MGLGMQQKQYRIDPSSLSMKNLHKSKMAAAVAAAYYGKCYRT
jgi:hypothetical protein